MTNEIMLNKMLLEIATKQKSKTFIKCALSLINKLKK